MSAHLELPRTDTVPHPKRYLLEPLRPVARWIIRRRYAVVVHHPARVPATGAVVVAGASVSGGDPESSSAPHAAPPTTPATGAATGRRVGRFTST